ncbi:hypothetical protein CRD60_06980 [Bifidobacterium aemilianum]|uniref:Uncharacterized protein n=1 Tax=Bifidobacterium aemilianum TaxID=2493120 RepID=A0A366K8B5_9BIFI|nr:hypothetical protein [Bifidobacterium aemilianum]RBP97363.1 hypothetical protein CRD60_06980 [Bifidobacterium aemilianum]
MSSTSRIPDSIKLDEVVGLTLSFSTPGQLIKSSSDNRGILVLENELRDKVRSASTGYDFTQSGHVFNPGAYNEYVVSPPFSLDAGASITGPQDCTVNPKWNGKDCINGDGPDGMGQEAVARPTSPIETTTNKGKAVQDTASPLYAASVFVVGTRYNVGAKVEEAGDSQVARDQRPTYTSRISVTNTGNAGADQLQLSTAKELGDNPPAVKAQVWDLSQQPKDTPNYSLLPNSFFDTNDVQTLSLELPDPSQAYMTLRTDDTPGTVGGGKWTKWFKVTSGAVTLPAGITAKEITGLRLKVIGGTPTDSGLIEAGDSAVVTIESRLRASLRSKSTDKAPIGEPTHMDGSR